MLSLKQIVKQTADMVKLPQEKWEQLPSVMKQVLQMAQEPHFLVTIDVDLRSGNARTLTNSKFPSGGTVDELARASQAMMQVAQFYQQQALAAAKKEGIDDKTNTNGQTGRTDEKIDGPPDRHAGSEG